MQFGNLRRKSNLARCGKPAGEVGFCGTDGMCRLPTHKIGLLIAKQLLPSGDFEDPIDEHFETSDILHRVNLGNDGG